VGVGGHVDGHAVDKGREVGAVVEVEAAQEVLVGLAVAAVLGDDHAGHEFEHLGRAQGRAAFDQPGCDGALAGRIGCAHRVVVIAVHGHGDQLRWRLSDLLRGRLRRGDTGAGGQGDQQCAAAERRAGHRGDLSVGGAVAVERFVMGTALQVIRVLQRFRFEPAQFL